jgi:hypothetical protein
MKISIGTNYFGSNKRQDIAKESHLRLVKKYDFINFFNIQFKDDTQGWNNNIDICNLHKLERSSRDVLPTFNRKLPFVNDCFKALSETDCDIFVFTNSDIILTDRLVDWIISNPDCKANTCQRVDINDINSLYENITPARIEVAGFDTFIFNKNWYIQHQVLFEDYFLGRVYFDYAYAVIMKIFGGNECVLNRLPIATAHIMHSRESHDIDAGNIYNKSVYDNSVVKDILEVWNDFLYEYVFKTRSNNFLTTHLNEKIIEKVFFDNKIEQLKSSILKIKADAKI